MTKLQWDQAGEHLFETGIDRGVLYRTVAEWVSGDGPPVLTLVSRGIPWNGLVSVDVKEEGNSITPLYFDGKKILDIVTDGDFAASLKAFTYPDEFLEFDGYGEFAPGLIMDDQPRGSFGLTYRTLIGNDLKNSDLGYKIHILYNLTAIADNNTYQTIDSNINPIIFGWNLHSIPEIIPGMRPTAHIIIDSLTVDPTALSDLEDFLYGSESRDPTLPTIYELLSYFSVFITDNLDGTWTAYGPEDLVRMTDSITFEIDGAIIGDGGVDGDYSISSTYS